MIYAKSNPVESLKEHTDKLVNNANLLFNIYGRKISKASGIEEEKIKLLLKNAALYHDLGKVFTPFQNAIRKKIREEPLDTNLENNIPHNILSPMFITKNVCDDEDFFEILLNVVAYHHERDFEINNCAIKLVDDAIKYDLKPQKEYLENEMGMKLKNNLNSGYLDDIKCRIPEKDKNYKAYIMLKGLLNKVDYSASAGFEVEEKIENSIGVATLNYINNNFKGNLRPIQKFAMRNRNENLVVIASTGRGKTEAGLLWINEDKGFFTLPLRVSINALFSRVKDQIGYESTGLLHSTSLEYLEEENEDKEEVNKIYNQSRLLSKKLSFSTIDQIFKFPLKYRGYERELATLSYSKVIIDEIQGYSPEICAILLKGIETLSYMGGQFMIMTATLPQIYKNYLLSKHIKFQTQTDLSEERRNVISVVDDEILNSIDDIVQKSKSKKVLVIVNTVKKAAEIYKKINEKQKSSYLLHAYFIPVDRAEKEKQIMEFSNKGTNGVWITTQIVEASLDIDFDYLFTDMSTLDSLFQRMGRCYRKRIYESNEPNIFIFIKGCTGIGKIYDNDIFNLSVESLKPFDMKNISEKEKVDLVDKIYSEESLKGTKFFEEFKDALKQIDSIIDGQLNKAKAQKILRAIDNINVVPRELFDKYNELFIGINKENIKERQKQIKKLTISVPKYKAKDKISEFGSFKDLYILNCKYDENIGVLWDEFDLGF